MARKFSLFHSEQKKRTTSGGSPQLLEQMFQKVTMPFDLDNSRNESIFKKCKAL